MQNKNKNKKTKPQKAFSFGGPGNRPVPGEGSGDPSPGWAAKGHPSMADVGPGCLCGQSLGKADGAIL